MSANPPTHDIPNGVGLRCKNSFFSYIYHSNPYFFHPTSTNAPTTAIPFGHPPYRKHHTLSTHTTVTLKSGLGCPQRMISNCETQLAPDLTFTLTKAYFPYLRVILFQLEGFYVV